MKNKSKKSAAKESPTTRTRRERRPAVPVRPTVIEPTRKEDLFQVQIVEAHSQFGVPKTFREANQARLAALLTGTKASELKYDAATRNAAFMLQWMRWALSEYRKIAAAK
jgi:hypothetical protein